MTPPDPLDLPGLARRAADLLLAELGDAPHWTGELSSSALATAVAVVALDQVNRQHGAGPDPLVERGLDCLAADQNPDGGWGDTDKSHSNVATTMLAQAAFRGTGTADRFAGPVQKSQAYLDRAGGTEAIRRRYGADRTFSVPILTHAAICGVVPWREVPRLPFELACLPPRFYAAVRLPVVSYALPALIAIGQVRHGQGAPWNPLTAAARHYARAPSLRRLVNLQPSNGGFLEATPLTAFVTMSLAHLGLASHPVAERGAAFLRQSVRPDGRWPIDTDLATWGTTLAVNALGSYLPADRRPGLVRWLLDQQYKEVHPFTQAAPGGWAWTDKPGGVPDADDTSGALLALARLCEPNESEEVEAALAAGARWLVDLQNRDGGVPTFCRGWGTLPFDRSSADITAHALRAWTAVADRETLPPGFRNRLPGAVRRAMRFLRKRERPDGSTLPLWFGNQHHPAEENPAYGTSRVLLGFRATLGDDAAAGRGATRWLLANQNADGGWGAGPGTPSSVEETGAAIESLAGLARAEDACRRGAAFLAERLAAGTLAEPAPIGFYFAKLWYYECLYPLVFATAGLRAVADAYPEPSTRATS